MTHQVWLDTCSAQWPGSSGGEPARRDPAVDEFLESAAGNDTVARQRVVSHAG